MRAALVTAGKFVGTVSLGLLTGLSYTLSTLTLPSLFFLPTAPTAATVHAHLQATSQRTRLLLTSAAATALTLSFLLSPPRAKHPYLVWTSVFAILGAAPLGKLGLFSPGVTSMSASASATDAQTAQANKEMKRRDIDESGVIISSGSAGSDDDSGDEERDGHGHGLGKAVNGEIVRRRVDAERALEAVRAGVYGVGFAMAVVGVWGDGA